MTEEQKSKHRYSTYLLVFILTTAMFISAVALTQSSDFDEVCNTNGAIMKKFPNGTWTCSLTHYAQGWFHNDTNPITITISSADTYYNITGFALENFRGVDALGNQIRINKNGTYHLDLSTSFTGGNGGIYEFELFVNGAEQPMCSYTRSTSSTAIGNAGTGCIVDLKKDDLLLIKVEDQNAPPQDIDLYSINFNIKEIH